MKKNQKKKKDNEIIEKGTGKCTDFSDVVLLPLANYTHPLHAMDDQSALTGLTASRCRQGTILQCTHCCISQIGTVTYMLIDRGRTETQCLLQTLGASTYRNFCTLNEHKVHSDGTSNGLRLIGTWLQWQQLGRCWSHGQLINAHQTETQKFGRI